MDIEWAKAPRIMSETLQAFDNIYNGCKIFHPCLTPRFMTQKKTPKTVTEVQFWPVETGRIRVMAHFIKTAHNPTLIKRTKSTRTSRFSLILHVHSLLSNTYLENS